MTLIISV